MVFRHEYVSMVWLRELDPHSITYRPEKKKACDSYIPTSFPGLFPLKLGGAGKDPGIGWSRDSKHPKILGVINYDVMNV